MGAKPTFKYVAYGRCQKCGGEMIRPPEVSIAACDCQSVVEVPLRPAILFRMNSRLFKKINRICEVFSVPIEDFVMKLYEIVLSNKEFVDDFVKQVRGGWR